PACPPLFGVRFRPGIGQDEPPEPVGVAAHTPESHVTPHGQAHQHHRLPDLKVVEEGHDVVGAAVHGEGLLTHLGLAEAPQVHRDGPPTPAHRFHLPPPHGAVHGESVHKHHGHAAAHIVEAHLHTPHRRLHVITLLTLGWLAPHNPRPRRRDPCRRRVSSLTNRFLPQAHQVPTGWSLPPEVTKDFPRWKGNPRSRRRCGRRRRPQGWGTLPISKRRSTQFQSTQFQGNTGTDDTLHKRR